MNPTRWQKFLLYSVLGGGALLFTVPLLWTVVTALKTPEAAMRIPMEWLPFREGLFAPQWENFLRVWTELPFARFAWNTLFITTLSAIGQVLSASLVAYGFARFDFPGKKVLFILLISTMLLPNQVTMLPVFLIWRSLGLVDTFVPLILPAWLGGGAFYIFLLRQFYMSLPRELDEAAMIDGASYFRIWWNIIVPLSLPALATVVIFSVVASWDDFLNPLIYLHSEENFTLTLGLRLFQGDYGVDDLPLLMAAALWQILPIVALFLFCQRYFIRSTVMTGVKG